LDLFHILADLTTGILQWQLESVLTVGVPRHSGLATLPSVGAVP